MSLETKDLELIERIIYKNGDDIAVSISRSFEHLEERVATLESRMHSRLAEIEDKIESTRQDLDDTIGELKEEVRELVRLRDGIRDEFVARG